MKLPELAEKIARTFDLSDLRGLCFQLSIDYDDLSGQNKKDKIIALVNYCKNRQRLEELVHQCQKLRPKETWHFDESWYLAKTIPPQQPRPLNLWVWITGAIVVALLIFGLVNFLPYFLSPNEPIPTEIAEATSTPTATNLPPTPTACPIEAAVEGSWLYQGNTGTIERLTFFRQDHTLVYQLSGQLMSQEQFDAMTQDAPENFPEEFFREMFTGEDTQTASGAYRFIECSILDSEIFGTRYEISVLGSSHMILKDISSNSELMFERQNEQ
ncbi:MAG TPA: hypothetical protein PLK31_16620 [Chloroflexota bacterium]|nr:hypothetical protein [Chloroflexota bacterium]